MMIRLNVALLLILLATVVYGQVAQIEFVEMPDVVTEYLEEYLLAGSLVNYFIETQLDTNCEGDWLELKYKDEYVVFCIFDDIKDGSSHLFVGIGGKEYLGLRQLLILWNGSLMHHEVQLGPTAQEIRTFIPSLEQQPGEYLVYVNIEDEGEVAHKTARFIIDPMGAVEE